MSPVSFLLYAESGAPAPGMGAAALPLHFAPLLPLPIKGCLEELSVLIRKRETEGDKTERGRDLTPQIASKWIRPPARLPLSQRACHLAPLREASPLSKPAVLTERPSPPPPNWQSLACSFALLYPFVTAVRGESRGN